MEKDNLPNSANSGFKTPKNYFETLEDHVLDQLALNEIDSSGFKTPKNYFETIENQVLNNSSVKQKPTNVISLLSKKHILYLSGIAASIVIFFNLNYFKAGTNFDSLEAQTVENYILNENMNTYDIAALLTDTELKEENFINMNLSSANIESYLIDQIDLETIITE